MKCKSLALVALLLIAPSVVAAPDPSEQVAARILARGVISTPGNEFSGAMTPDGASIYFSRSVPRSYMYAIFVSKKARDGKWSKPQLAPFSGHGRDFDAVLSPNGQKMVFISDRPTAKGQKKRDYDVWMLERTATGAWGEPRHLGFPVNTEKAAGDRSFNNNEWFASITDDGTLYVASDGYEPGGKMQIYRVRPVEGHYQSPENLGPAINGEGYANGEPIVSPDGSFLLFSSFGRKGGFGNWDIYISTKQPDGSWGSAENLGPVVNTSARDYSPRLEPDGHTLIFTSERNFTTGRTTPVSWPELKTGALGLLNGNGNLYEIDLCGLKLKSFSCAR